MFDTVEARTLAQHYRHKAILMSGTQETLEWYHTTLSLALARIDELEQRLWDKQVETGKSLTLVDTTSGQ